MIGKQGFGLFGQGGGTEIVILRLQPQTGIPDAAAYGIGGEAGIFQRADTGADILGQIQGQASSVGTGASGEAST